MCALYKYAFPCFHANLFEIRNINGTRTCIVKTWKEKRVKIILMLLWIRFQIPNSSFKYIYISRIYALCAYSSKRHFIYALDLPRVCVYYMHLLWWVYVYMRAHIIISLDMCCIMLSGCIYYGCRYTSPLMLFVYLHLYAEYIGIICIFNINEWIFVCLNTDKLKYLGNKEISCSI